MCLNSRVMTRDKILIKKFILQGENDRGYYGNLSNNIILKLLPCFDQSALVLWESFRNIVSIKDLNLLGSF